MWREIFDEYRHYGEIVKDVNYIKHDCLYRELTISYKEMTKIFTLRNGDLVGVKWV